MPSQGPLSAKSAYFISNFKAISVQSIKRTRNPQNCSATTKCSSTRVYVYPRLRVHIAINRAIYYNQILNVRINLREHVQKMASIVSIKRLKLSSELLPRRPEIAAYQMTKSKNCRSLYLDGDVVWRCRSAPKMTHNKFLFAALLNFIRLGPNYACLYPHPYVCQSSGMAI